VKILIIEDDKELAANLYDTFKSDNYIPTVAHCGAEAFDALRDELFDLVILDLNLPDISGIEILDKIRKELDSCVQVLILSAKYELDDRVLGLDSGADDYLAKPFSLVELKARIRALLRRNSPNKQVSLEINGIVINIADRKVTKDDAEVSLTPKEFAILELFFYNKNTILTSIQIAEHIYTDYFDKSSNIINMHIKNIRTKLKDQTCIETVRGVGFRLNS
jgi:two-component system, OmpR family, response regulator